GDIGNGEVSHINIATGSVLSQFSSSPSTELAGLAIVGEITVATQCSPPLNLLGNPGFESPVAAASGLPAPLSVGNWEPISGQGATPEITMSSPHCGLFSGQVRNGYWVQDLPLGNDP